MSDRPSAALHTFVVSDLHLSDAQPVEPRRPLWKLFKTRDRFIDGSLARFFSHLQGLGEGPLELVLNGDIFDFDSVMAIPGDAPFPVSWLERTRGLDPEEAKSAFKISVILQEHDVFVQALRGFLAAGHRVVFVIGNHDMELHWPEVQARLRQALGVPDARQPALRFCEWFYVSNADTLIEHGNQYDDYCVCANPIHPFVQRGGKKRVRLPFGNLAGKYMLNGMGLFNPQVERSFIRSGREYLVFFVRYMLWTQPLLAWTWFWSALVTLVVTLREGFLPELRDAFTIEEHVDGIASRANATPRIVRGLQALHVHPVVFKPMRIVRELWLDRALLLGLGLVGTFQLFSFVNLFVSLRLWWWVLLFGLLLPPFIFYARGVTSDVTNFDRRLRRRLVQASRLAGVRRFVMGHTHVEEHTDIDGVELINTGTWSPAYHDVECTQPFGLKCFAWVRPGPQGRVAELCRWLDPGSEALARRPFER